MGCASELRVSVEKNSPLSFRIAILGVIKCKRMLLDWKGLLWGGLDSLPGGFSVGWRRARFVFDSARAYGSEGRLCEPGFIHRAKSPVLLPGLAGARLEVFRRRFCPTHPCGKKRREDGAPGC